MYKGKRDPEVGIVVRQSLCNVYRGKDSIKWVEVFIPRSDKAQYEWGTIMVKPEQVDFIDDTYNLVRVNDGAEIVNSTKEKDTHNILDCEKMTPAVIIGHVLRQELNLRGRDAADIYRDYIDTGLTMYNYIRRNTPITQVAQPQASSGIPITPEN